MANSLAQPLRDSVSQEHSVTRLRWAVFVSLCLFATVFVPSYQALIKNVNCRGIAAQRNIGAVVVEKNNKVKAVAQEQVKPLPAIQLKPLQPVEGAQESLENSTVRSFYEAKLQEGLVLWKQKKLWFHQSLVAQRRHTQFQCYVSRKHQFKVCTSPKVSSSVWKAVFCELNGRNRSKCGSGTADWYEPGLSRFSTMVNESQATIVRIIRDPLERLVSAYFDKCVHDRHRRGEKHCHPRELMLKQPKEYFLKREVFAEWVDFLGHDWDEHVMPQCAEAYFPHEAVPYSPQPYTHVLDMGDGYMKAIEAMLETAQLLSAEEKSTILAKFNASFARRPSAEKLRKRYRYYYSRSVAARALQYYAMDYKCLNVSLPDWLLNVTS